MIKHMMLYVNKAMLLITHADVYDVAYDLRPFYHYYHICIYIYIISSA